MKMRTLLGSMLVGLAACAAPESIRPPQIGEAIADYAVTNLDGEMVSLSSMRSDVVLMNLWATWCAPCRKETPFLQELHEELNGEGLQIVGISMDTGDAADQVAMFVEEYEVTYTVLHDPQMRGMDLYRVLGLPATFLIDREGNLQWMRYGPVGETDSEFRNALEDALR